MRPIRAPARASASTISRGRLGRPAPGHRRGDDEAARRVAQRQHADVAIARGVVLRHRGDQADREAGGDDAAGGERVVALERDPRLEAGGAAELPDQPGRGRGRALDPGVVAQPGQLDLGLARERMRARDDGVHRFLEQQPLLDVGGAARTRAPEHHGEVDVATAQRRERPRRTRLADRDRGVGQPPPQVGDGQRHEPRQRRGVAREPDAPLLERDEVGDLDLGELQPGERGAGVLDEQPAGVGQLRAAARARDQRRADLRLERRQVLGDGGLGEGQRVGGGGQRAVVCDRAQRAQAPKVIHK